MGVEVGGLGHEDKRDDNARSTLPSLIDEVRSKNSYSRSFREIKHTEGCSFGEKSGSIIFFYVDSKKTDSPRASSRV